MIGATDGQLREPYESAEELRKAHDELLSRLDDRFDQDSSGATETEMLSQLVSYIRRFVERGAATGAYIEEIRKRSECQTLVDYWTSRLASVGVQIERSRMAPFDSTRLPKLPDEACPYVGLESFTEKSQSLFFGREAATREVVEILRRQPRSPGGTLIVISGQSGSGKSSLIRGGVLPQIKTQDWAKRYRIVPTFVPGTALLKHMAIAVRQHGDAVAIANIATDVEAIRTNPQHLATMLEPTRPTLITIDQFEEIFTLSDKVDREAMLGNLAYLLKTGQGHRVIWIVRAEFERNIKEILGPFDGRYEWYDRMGEMDYQELKDAILKPAEEIKLHIQADVVEHIVRRLLHQPTMLPLLQFTLQSLWRHRDHNRITREVYNRVGSDPLTFLGRSATEFLKKHADPETWNEIKRVLLELVRIDDLLEAYRQPVAESRLLAAGRANTKDVLKLLDDSGFVRITPDPEGQDAVVEVKHESLIRNWPTMVTWILEKRAATRPRLALTEAAEQWKLGGRRPIDVQALLTGAILKGSAEQIDLSELEREYIQDAKKATGIQLNEWLNKKAFAINLQRAVAWYAKQVSRSPEEIVNAYYEHIPYEKRERERDGSWYEAEKYLISEVFDGTFPFIDIVRSESFELLEGKRGTRWLDDVTKLKAYHLWQKRGGGWGSGQALDDYFAIWRSFRDSLSKAELKLEKTIFGPVQRYIGDHYLDNEGQIDIEKSRVKILMKAKEERLEREFGLRKDDAESAAMQFMEGYYENITNAIMNCDNGATCQVLKAIGLLPPSDRSASIVNCFEEAVAIFFLDARIVSSLLGQ